MMTEGVGWHHTADESDQWDGFNEPGIETFAGAPMQSLAREVNQNALDAGESDLVDVHIKLHRVPTATIPNVEELKENLAACHAAAANESRKAQIFFQNALTELDKPKIEVLEISDYNTKGMTGPSTNGTAFYAFMKAKGQSRKESGTATGSYGIGKFAPYSASKIRTIFVSTVFQDENGNYHQFTQGKSILMSHDQDGTRKQGVGFWGVRNKCQPIVGVSNDLPSWIQRVNDKSEFPSKKGSKLSVLCFNSGKNWQEELAVSVAENFFGAISEGKLRVDIDEKYVLDQVTIKEFFLKNDIRGCIDKLKNEPDHFDNCRTYLQALEGKGEVFVEESEMRELGLCQLRILVGEGLKKKVCILRNGMFISDSLNRLKSFSDMKEFVAVFHCQSTKGNELLRAMEPPKHDDFEPERLPTKEEQRKGAQALRDMQTWIRNMLKRHAKDPVSDVTEIDELKEFFGDESSEGSGAGMEEINPYGEVVIRAKPVKMSLYSKLSNTGANTGDGIDVEDSTGGGAGTGEGRGEGRGDGNGNGGNGTDTGGGGGSGGKAQKPLVDINNVRSVPLGERQRKVAFTPVKTGRVAVRLLEAGADSDYELGIMGSDSGEVSEGRVVIEVRAGKRVNLDVQLQEAFSGAVKVVAHEI